MAESEQRRALAGTVPTTEVIRDAVTFPRDRLGEPLDISGDRFDAWLHQVRRDAWQEGYDRAQAVHCDAIQPCDVTTPNPYEETP